MSRHIPICAAVTAALVFATPVAAQIGVRASTAAPASNSEEIVVHGQKKQIAKALRISAETLYVRAGILEERVGDHDLVGEILRDPMLTEDQKQTLVRVYLSFTHENEGKGAPAPSPASDAQDEAGLLS